jgi:hypothetical protein
MAAAADSSTCVGARLATPVTWMGSAAKIPVENSRDKPPGQTDFRQPIGVIPSALGIIFTQKMKIGRY